jgi:hypothetical protein
VNTESPQEFQQTIELYNSKKNFKNAWAIFVIAQFQIVILESKFHHSQIHSNHFSFRYEFSNVKNLLSRLLH